MKKIDLNLNYNEIRTRIEKDKNKFKPGKWAENIGVSPATISNVHGKSKQNPSLEYVIAVAKFTKKSIEYFLWGEEENSEADIENTSDYEHTELVELLKQKEKNNEFKSVGEGIDAINALLTIEKIDERTFRRAVADLKYIADKLKEGGTPGPIITVPENKPLGELTKEKDNI